MSKRYTCEVAKEVLSLAAHDHPTATAEHRQQMYSSIAEIVIRLIVLKSALAMN